jgi:hypothetical protein
VGVIKIKTITILLIVTLMILTACKEIPKEQFCETDQDCIPDACCHPTSCTNKEFKPICKEIACTMECSPNSLDCGQGSCICQNNKCRADFNNPSKRTKLIQ